MMRIPRDRERENKKDTFGLSSLWLLQMNRARIEFNFQAAAAASFSMLSSSWADSDG
jgi:hypothetical protein